MGLFTVLSPALGTQVYLCEDVLGVSGSPWRLRLEDAFYRAGAEPFEWRTPLTTTCEQSEPLNMERNGELC
jgi:hypothetical protein